MGLPSVTCSVCGTVWPGDEPGAPPLTRCPGCARLMEVVLFPELESGSGNPPTAQAQQVSLEGEEAACFYHAKNRAVVPCDLCGRFLCSLCDIPLDQGHYCPGCVERGRKQARFATLERHRVLYGEGAFLITLISLFPLLWFFSLMTAPVAMGMVAYGGKKPLSLVRPTRWPGRVAFCISGLMLAGWVLFFIAAALDS